MIAKRWWCKPIGFPQHPWDVCPFTYKNVTDFCGKLVGTWNPNDLYFWRSTPPKQGLFQSKQGSFGFQVNIYTNHMHPTRTGRDTSSLKWCQISIHLESDQFFRNSTPKGGDLGREFLPRCPNQRIQVQEIQENLGRTWGHDPDLTSLKVYQPLYSNKSARRARTIFINGPQSMAL